MRERERERNKKKYIIQQGLARRVEYVRTFCSPSPVFLCPVFPPSKSKAQRRESKNVKYRMRETERERGGAISHHRTFCLALPCHGGCLYAVFCCIQKELGWMILQNRMREERIGPDSFLRPTIILDQGAVQSELRAFQALVAPCAPGQNTLPLAKRRNCLSFHKHLPLSTRCPSSLFLPLRLQRREIGQITRKISQRRQRPLYPWECNHVIMRELAIHWKSGF